MTTFKFNQNQIFNLAISVYQTASELEGDESPTISIIGVHEHMKLFKCFRESLKPEYKEQLDSYLDNWNFIQAHKSQKTPSRS